MLHILRFTLAFPAMCLLVVSAPNGFELIAGTDRLLTAASIAYAVTVVPGLIVAISDHVLTRFNVRFRPVYCAFLAAIVTAVFGMWAYPGGPYYYVSNAIFYASIGAVAALLCSLLNSGIRSRFGYP